MNKAGQAFVLSSTVTASMVMVKATVMPMKTMTGHWARCSMICCSVAQYSFCHPGHGARRGIDLRQ
ncbi:hypothetical protein SLG_03830 [Sphingobium sp. SYK-6]|nr:hypothetical protein SLG_03830 [Sphingobium sp. SYK-6]